jgi:hypothetical protein
VQADPQAARALPRLAAKVGHRRTRVPAGRPVKPAMSPVVSGPGR